MFPGSSFFLVQMLNMVLRLPVFLGENSSSFPHSLDPKAAKAKKARGGALLITSWNHNWRWIYWRCSTIPCVFNSLFDLLCSISDISTIFVIAAILLLLLLFYFFKAVIYYDYTPRGLHPILSQRCQKSSGVSLEWPIVLLAGLWKKSSTSAGTCGTG